VKRSLVFTGKLFLTVHVVGSYIGYVGSTHGISMVPTIPHSFYSHPYILESHLHRRGRNIKVGDVITFTHPVIPSSKMSKRVVGMPGDFVSVMTPGREGEDMGKQESEGDWANVKERLVQVPEGHCWVAGDNLEWSRDSRMFGALPLGLVKGKVLAVVWPVRTWKWIGNDSQLDDVGTEQRDWVQG
jgi:inner membrane protease subunit 1